MTRQDILESYTVDSGIIRSPGKFEGEMLYAPYFWDAFLNGSGDEDDGISVKFYINELDRKEFPELEGIDAISLTTCPQGFVYCSEE